MIAFIGKVGKPGAGSVVRTVTIEGQITTVSASYLVVSIGGYGVGLYWTGPEYEHLYAKVMQMHLDEAETIANSERSIRMLAEKLAAKHVDYANQQAERRREDLYEKEVMLTRANTRVHSLETTLKIMMDLAGAKIGTEEFQENLRAYKSLNAAERRAVCSGFEPGGDAAEHLDPWPQDSPPCYALPTKKEKAAADPHAVALAAMKDYIGTFETVPSYTWIFALRGKGTAAIAVRPHRDHEILKALDQQMREYIAATEFWKIEPHDQKERQAYMQKIKALMREDSPEDGS